ncbi:DUF2057 domain-containing protein [Psychromonas algarum]|uniref:DUF2057 domain-containing protein n=1 Tax=Psychromonas algarum TaxID=2555643 RepID=UPI0014199CFB|nr:DUF2057 domain-containing protein [Psychromonas sp. RZ22]
MKVTGLFLALVVSPFAFSGEIIPSNNIEILAINGVKAQSSFFGSKDIEVEDGPQQVVVKYIDSFGNEDFIESRPYIFTINIDGKTSIRTEKFNNLSQATKQIDNGLKWYVKNQKGEFQVEKAEQLKGKGFMPYSDIEAIVAEYNKNNITVADIKNNSHKVPAKNSNALIEQYKISNKAQRKEFKMWLIENETK